MSLTAEFRHPRDLLAKLHREHDSLVHEISSDTFFNFVVTGYHLTDWIKNDTSVPASAQSDLGSMHQNIYVAACRDIANAIKHFTLRPNYKGQVTAKTSAASGFGAGRYGKGAYGKGEQSIVVELTSGQRFQVLDFAQEVVDAWDTFFKKHAI
jgi:hypothetical protein